MPQPALISVARNAAGAQHRGERLENFMHECRCGGGWLSSGVPGDRHERHDERIDAERDQLFAGRKDRLLGVAEAGQNIGRYLPAPEHRNRRGKRVEIALERDLCLARHDPRAHLRRHRFEMHAERIDAGALHAREPDVVVGRLALALNRQIDGRFHGGGALGKDRGATIAAGRRAGGHHHMRDAVELDGGGRDFGKLRRRLALDRAPAASDCPMAQNWQVLVRL